MAIWQGEVARHCEERMRVLTSVPIFNSNGPTFHMPLRLEEQRSGRTILLDSSSQKWVCDGVKGSININ